MAGVWLALLRHWRSDTEDSERVQQRLELFKTQLNESADTLPWLLAQDRRASRHIHYTSAYCFYGHCGTYAVGVKSVPYVAS